MNHPPELAPSPQEIRDQLRRILQSGVFSSAKRLSAFLEYAVQTSLAGGQLKEAVIGVEVYGRDASYDPKQDSIVRAEATRLRAKLREYYETEGKGDPVWIELPKGGYQAIFRSTVSAGPAPEPPVSRRRWLWILPACATAGLVLGALLLSRGSKPRSIALIPLQVVGSGSTIDRLGNSLTRELLGALVVSKAWNVAGLAEGINGIDRDEMREALRSRLPADVALAGSIREGDKTTVRVDLQLVNVADGYLLWTATYHSAVRTMAESVRELAGRIGEEVNNVLTGRPLPSRSAQYYKARELWSSYTELGLKQSIPLFEQAIRSDARFAAAWAGLADANLRLVDQSKEIDTRSHIDAARAAALQALQLDDSNAEAQGVLGTIYLDKDWNFPDAVGALRRAVVLDPTRLSLNVTYSRALAIVGDLDDAEEAIRLARARLPAIPDLLLQHGSIYFLAHKFEKMEAIGRELVALAPDLGWGHWLVGVSLEQRGRVREAIATFESGLRQPRDDLRILCALSHAYGQAGDSARALATMRRYLDPAQPVTRFTLSYCAALTYTSLKQYDQAFDWLERALQGKDASFPFFPYDPRFDVLQKDARYSRLAAALKR